MIDKTISHYKIIEKLGGGGMGVVYKARDTKLDRFVALKFLPLTLTSDLESKERFIHEAKAASALEHPNLCNIHEINETEEGQMYIVMACYEGEILEKKIERGPLKLKEAVDIAIQIAQGLEKAHKKEIVHRDIKPANIMITNEGEVKILDFGLAKLGSQTRLTKAGSTIGTVAYMSPEQAQGEIIDHRTDIWSLGVVLYEMVAGKLPFQGDYEQAMIYSIMTEEPVPLKEIPGDLEWIVKKALSKKLEKRYQRVVEIKADLEEFRKKTESDATELKASSKKPVSSIAVLPFIDMSPQRDQEYFCDGMAEEIINALTQLKNLRVIARTSSFVFKNKQEDVREIGKKLNVDTLLEGSVRKAGNRLRITTQLVKVSDGFHIWSERYDCDIEDVFNIQDEIAQNIVHALKLKLSTKEKRVLSKVATKDIQAYDFYLRGRKFLYRAGCKSVSVALEMFTKAIERDPGYARAYAGIADCSSWLFMYIASTKENLKQSIEASQKAIELDSELPEAHAARALALSLSKEYEESEEEFEKAIQLNSKLYEAYYFYARTCFVQGKLEKAAKLFEEACLVNPDDYQTPFLLANSYKGLNLIEKAEKAYRRGLKIVEKHMELNPDDARAFYLGAHGLIELGDHENGFQWCKRALEIDPEDPSLLYNISCAHSLGGKTEEAIIYLERAIDMGYSHREWIDNDSYLDPIRKHPRFCTLLKKLE